jgi:hypothetical protein
VRQKSPDTLGNNQHKSRFWRDKQRETNDSPILQREVPTSFQTFKSLYASNYESDSVQNSSRPLPRENRMKSPPRDPFKYNNRSPSKEPDNSLEKEEVIRNFKSVFPMLRDNLIKDLDEFENSQDTTKYIQNVTSPTLMLTSR